MTTAYNSHRVRSWNPSSNPNLILSSNPNLDPNPNPNPNPNPSDLGSKEILDIKLLPDLEVHKCSIVMDSLCMTDTKLVVYELLCHY